MPLGIALGLVVFIDGQDAVQLRVDQIEPLPLQVPTHARRRKTPAYQRRGPHLRKTAIIHKPRSDDAGQHLIDRRTAE